MCRPAILLHVRLDTGGAGGAGGDGADVGSSAEVSSPASRAAAGMYFI